MSLSSDADDGTACVPRLLSWRASGSVATSAAWDCSEELPSAIRAGRAALANGTRFWNWRPSADALWPSDAISGVPWSARLPSETISGRSWRRNCGNSWNDREMSLARAALATDVVFACVTNPAIWLLTFASGASTLSESVASWASWRFWRARIFSTWSV